MSAITLTLCPNDDSFPGLDIAKAFAQIKEHNRKANDGIEHMIEAGKLLTLLKSRLAHGQFIKLALSETNLSRSTISRYMQMAANVSHVKHLKSGRDAMETIALLSKPSEEVAKPSPSPRPSPAHVTIDVESETVDHEAEIVAPSPAPQADEPLTSEQADRLTDLESVIEKGSAEAYGTILELLLYLSKDQLGELRKIITTRWLP